MALLVETKTLIRRLTPTCYKALEAAVLRAANARCYEIVVEHVLLELLQSETGDAARILHQYGQDRGRLIGRVQRALEGLRTGNAGKPVFSATLFQWFEDAWTVASLEQDANRIRSGALIQQFVMNPGRYSAENLAELEAIPREQLRSEFADLVAPSPESVEVGVASQATGAAGGAPAGAAPGGGVTAGGENLKRFTTNYTAKARAGEIDPVFGRHREIRQLVDILARRRKNNPIIVGEPGVGKTALVEGLANAIVAGDVPGDLRNVDLLGLDLGALSAGAGV
jgi:type VI secretion system protein VasG